MENLEIKKHWLWWGWFVVFSILTVWSLIFPILILGYAFLRWKLDKIEIVDGILKSREGLICINKKAIPLDKISMVNTNTNFISEMLHAGDLIVQSSAENNAIKYSCIENPEIIVDFINKNK